jgi:putative DNA primase/helicase
MSDDFKGDTQGRWRSILLELGVEERMLDGKARPCPICKEGRDRFTFDDKDGHGTFICRKCGAGGGLKLAALFMGVEMAEAMRRIRPILPKTVPNTAPRSKKSPDARMAEMLWNESVAITEDDPVMRYLRARGLALTADRVPKDLRLHPKLSYYENRKSIGTYPAMLALIRDLAGKAVTVHRHYLSKDGRKAPVPEPKKLASGFEAGCIRLYKADPEKWLGIAEGVGTALAASHLFKLPVWSAVDAGHLERWQPPEGITRVAIFGDHDSSFTGQASAFTLAKKLVAKKGITARVIMPTAVDTDWLDVINDPKEMKRWTDRFPAGL